MSQHFGPQTQASDIVHTMKYRGPHEDFRELGNRLAFALQDSNAHYHAMRDIILTMRFMFGGRIQSSIGTSRTVTPFNCYVSGTLADSYVHGAGCIMDRAKEAATTLRMGGGIGYDFSTLRPEGDPITKLQTQACGPVGFMDIFNVIGDRTVGYGHRFGAQMGMLRVDHPDIESFIRVKQNEHMLRRFNLSITVIEPFMEALYAGKDFELRWPVDPKDPKSGRVYRTVEAAALWEMIMRSTWDWGEPGICFIDRINEMNNLWYCETIAATNPCGEQPLPPYGACLLGSFNLVKYLTRQTPQVVVRDSSFAGISSRWAFDFDQLAADIPHVVRATDKVIDVAKYPLMEQRLEARTKRRMGLGVMGLANAIEACGHPYGSPGFLDLEDRIMAFLCDHAYLASIDLAKEKGHFEAFDADRYLASGFMKTRNPEIRDRIARDGIRNSHLTSCAPTGTIAFCADNVSSGVEPVFDLELDRDVTTPDGLRRFRVKDYGHAFLGVQGRCARDVTAEEHIRVLATAQRHVDSSVSKTVNVAGMMPWDEFKGIYDLAYKLGARSCTTFNEDGQRMGLLVAGGAKQPSEQRASAAVSEGDACHVDLATGRRECD